MSGDGGGAMDQLTEIQKHMLKTFLWLRIGIGAIGILFPFWLWGVGGAIYHLPLADSMSAYYHATTWCMDPRLLNDNGTSQCAGHVLIAGAGPMRDWFVGILFAIGVGLALIKGFSVWEDWMLTIAGALAVVVATNPMPWLPGADGKPDIHYPAAITFFVLIGLTIWFCSGKTLQYMPDIPNKEKWIKFFRTMYSVFAIVMPVSAGLAFLGHQYWHWVKGIFVAEAAGVITFGFYWLAKTWELSKSEVERRAMRGELQMDTMTVK
jgi:hypothetical protein